MIFKDTELKTPGLEITRFLTWSGHKGLLPPYFSPEAQGIGQSQASPFDSSSFGQDACRKPSSRPLHVNKLYTVLNFITALGAQNPPRVLLSWAIFILLYTSVCSQRV